MSGVDRAPRARRRGAALAIIGLLATLVSPLVATTAASAAAPSVAVGGGASLTLTGPADMTLPRFVKTVTGGAATGSSSHGVGLTATGQVYAWGDNDFGQLGPSVSAAQSTDPVAVPIPGERITDIVAGDRFTLALSDDGEVYAWGANTPAASDSVEGFLGVATIRSRAEPALVPGLPRIAQPTSGRSTVAAGLSNGYALDVNGQVWSWGRNLTGELGRADSTSNSPSAGMLAASGNVMTGKRIVSIQAGARAATARDESGDYYGWGDNRNGMLLSANPAGTAEHRRYPIAMYSLTNRASAPGALAGRLIRTLSVNLQYGLAVTTDANGANETIVVWGLNSTGQLGDGTTTDSPTPKVVDRTGTGMESERIEQVTLGGGHIVARSSTGKVFTWGNNTNGILGRPAATADLQRRPALATSLPSSADAVAGYRDTSVMTSTGVVTTVGLVTGGTVRTVGSASAPTVVVEGVELAASAVTARTANTVTITVPARSRAGSVDVAVRTIGRQSVLSNAYTSTLPAPTITSVTPARASVSASSTAIEILGSNFADGPRFNTVTAGESHAAALDTAGRVWVWGRDTSGLSGTGTAGAKTSPVALPAAAFGGRRIVQLDAASERTIVLAEDGSVFSWGKNDVGQVGDGSTTQRPTPVRLNPAVWQGKTIVAVAAGGNNTLALASDGSVFSWGSNVNGTVGNGTTGGPVTTPTLLPAASFGGKRVVQVATASNYQNVSYALAEDGTVYSWGSASYGQLGTGATTNSTSPALVNFAASGAGQVVDIDAGDGFVRVLDRTGAVYAWGLNDVGQVGDGTSTNRTVPVKIGDAATFGARVVALDAGYNTAALVLENGSVLVNGFNREGGLGDPALTTQAAAENRKVLVPTRVAAGPLGSGRAVGVASSLSITVVVLNDGTGAGSGSAAVGTGSAAAANPTMVALDLAPLRAAGVPAVTVDGSNATGVTRVSNTVVRATLGGRGSAAAGQFPLSLTAFDGQVATTGSTAFTFYRAPQAPTEVSTSIPAGQEGDSSVQLAWTAVPNASLSAQNGYSSITKYVVQYREAGTSGAYRVAPDGGAPLASTRTVGGLDTSREYEFRVCSVNEAVATVTETALAATCTATTSSTRPQFIELASAVTPVTTAVTPSDTGGLTSATTEVAVSTNNPAGYRLTVTSSTSALTKSGSTDAIAAVPATSGAPVSLSGSVYGWGYLVNRTSNLWAAVPTSGAGAVVGSSTGPATGATTAVTFGFRVPATQPSGTYRGTITYTAVVN